MKNINQIQLLKDRRKEEIAWKRIEKGTQFLLKIQYIYNKINPQTLNSGFQRQRLPSEIQDQNKKKTKQSKINQP